MSGPFFRCGGGGIPAGLQSGMDAVLNKKFGTSTTYPASGWPDNVNLLGPLPIIISNKAPIVSFNDGADDVPISEGTFYIAPSQSGTGTPSPSNPRPIVGYTGMTIQHTGKNLLNYADITDSYKITSITDNGNGSFTVVGSNNGAWIQHIVPVKAGQAYSIKCASATNDEGNASQIGVVDVWDGTDTTATKLLDGASITNRKGFTPTGNYILVRNRVTGGSGAGTGTINQPQLEIGTTATSFEAYKAKTPIVDAFGRTIYGGELNITTGVLTVTHGYIASYNGESINEPWISSIDAYVPNTSPSTGAQVAYTLATPQTYQLTPHELRTFYGANNFYCDTGDSQLNYRADISLYINNH